MLACLYLPDTPGVPPDAGAAGVAGRGDTPLRSPAGGLLAVARSYSPRVCVRDTRTVTLDIDGLARLFGDDSAVAAQLHQAAVEAVAPQVRVAVAATQTAAIILAHARPGVTVIAPGREMAALAPLPVSVLRTCVPAVYAPERVTDVSAGAGDTGRPVLVRGAQVVSSRGNRPRPSGKEPREADLAVLLRWGIRTLGQLAALPSAELSERLGQAGVTWQRWARGEDLAPMVPTLDEEIFEGTFEPEWPLDDLAALGLVFDRVLVPLCERLARRDRAVAIVHLALRLTTKVTETRSLQLPAPMRDPAVLRTLLVLALEGRPLTAGVDAVTLTLEPTPARVVQESLLTRAVPPPEHISTLMARLGALMGERRCGSPQLLDTHRPGACAMTVFTMEPKNSGAMAPSPSGPHVSLRRFRLPISARVQVEHGRPILVRTDRQALQGGAVRICAGPWRTSGDWWKTPATPPSELDKLRGRAGWNRDEWDVGLNDGGVYRIFEDRDTGRWFVEGIVD